MVTLVKGRFGYDDALDAFGVHGAGGTVGALLTGVFAAQAINPVDRMACVFLATAAEATAPTACVADTVPCATAIRFESKSRFNPLNSARISEAV